MKIGPWTLEGTDAQVAALTPMAVKMASVLTLPDGKYRVDDAFVRVRARGDMPWAIEPSDEYPKGVRAVGYWNGTNILIAGDQFGSSDHARKVLAHEVTHQLDDQWMMRSHQRDIKPLFEPDASGWPSEPFAVYGSAAIFGFTDPPYKTFYNSHRIPATEWPKVKSIALRDDRPVDPCLPYKEQITTLTTELETTKTALQEAEQARVACVLDLDTCRTSLTTAKENAQETIDLPAPEEA